MAYLARVFVASVFLLLPTLSVRTAEDAGAGKAEEFEALLRKLEKDITAVRGLEFKAPVKAKIISRPADADRGAQGYYNIKDKTLYVYDDLKGSYQRGVLIHEMVHALQDQHFHLKALHEQAEEGDAALALAALIEGDANLTMIELLKKDQPRVAAVLDYPLQKSRNLRNAFLYAQGARYVKALKDKGGWKAVNNAYRFPPGSTAEVLHPGERITPIDLGTGKTVGEYGIIARLWDVAATRAGAVDAAAGWRGDCLIEKGKDRAWIIAFSTAKQAQSFADVLRTWTAQKEAASEGHWTVRVQGTKVIQLLATDEAGLKQLNDSYEGPLKMEVYLPKQGRFLSFGELIELLLDADVICVGESHDSDLHHQVQLQIIKGLYARDERLGVGMEMFQRPYQKEIDRYFAGANEEEAFLKATDYLKRWGFEWTLYRPIVEFCRKNNVPLAALNLSTELRRRLSEVGHGKLSDDEKKQLGPIDFNVREHRDYWYERLAQMHGTGVKVSEDRKEKSYQVMTAWDDYMAASAALFQKERNIRRMVILAGSGHVDNWFGIPRRTIQRTGGVAATIKIETVGTGPARLEGKAVADYYIFVH